jgi:hypothetical protein
MGKATKPKINPLCQYHPIRFIEARKDFVSGCLDSLNETYPIGIEAIFNRDNHRIQKPLKKFFQGRSSHIKVSESSSLYPAFMRLIYMYMAVNTNSFQQDKGFQSIWSWIDCLNSDDFFILRNYFVFLQSGSNIFDISEDLIELFSVTNVGNVLVKDIVLPFSTIYLHFGKQDKQIIYGNMSMIQPELLTKNLKYGDGKIIDFYLDGAYVSQCQATHSLRITLTTKANQIRKHYSNCIDCFEDTITFDLDLLSPSMTVEEALNIEHQQLLDINHQLIDTTPKYTDLSPQLLQFQQRGKADIERRIESLKESINLIINSLLYLQSYPEEIREDYPSDAPIHLIRQVEKENFSSKLAANKLNELGYRKIKFCGQKTANYEIVEDEIIDFYLDKLTDAERELFLDKNAVSPHKRRAHLRKQKYGKGLKEWRYVWIKETTIHPDKYDYSSNLYRIYEV